MFGKPSDPKSSPFGASKPPTSNPLGQKSENKTKNNPFGNKNEENKASGNMFEKKNEEKVGEGGVWEGFGAVFWLLEGGLWVYGVFGHLGGLGLLKFWDLEGCKGCVWKEER